MRSASYFVLLPGLALILAGCATTHTESPHRPAPLDCPTGQSTPDGSLVWFSALDIGV